MAGLVSVSVAEPFYPYPAVLPLVEVKFLLGFVRGLNTDLPLAVQAGWVVVGFAVSQLVPTGTGPVGSMASVWSRPHAEVLLEAELCKLEVPADTALVSVDWGRVLRLLLDLLGRYFAGG